MAESIWKQRIGMGLVATLAGTGCTSPGKDTAPVAAKASVSSTVPASTTASYQQGSVGFSSFTSQEVRKAALDYGPVEAIAPEAPISLTADDGTGLVLESLDANAVIEGPLAFTELRLRFRNPQSRVLEGRFQITLPDGASVSRLAMRMDEGWREAEVVELQAARRAYEDFLHRKQDPMLLEKEAGNQFRARIFPIPANGIKEVIISFSQELHAEDGYTLPLRGLPAIADLQVRAQVAEKTLAGVRYQSQGESAKGTVPTKDFHVPIAPSLTALRHGSHIVARLQPKLSVKATRPKGLTILFDTSASRAPGFAKQVQRLGSLVRAIGKAQGQGLPLRVAAFDQEVMPVFSGELGEFGDAQLEILLSRRPLGASDVGGALAWAGQQQGADRLLLIGDAVATAGSQEVAALAKGLPASIARIDMLLVGGIRDVEAAGTLVRGSRASDGVVLQEDMSDEEIAKRLGSATTSISLSVPGAKWVWPQSVDGVQPGDELLVYAGFEGKEAPASFAVNVQGAERIAPVPTTIVPGPLLERAAVQSRIAALQSDYISELAKDKKAAIKARIVDLSTTHRVLSDYTALLVLETEQDYARFGIDRRALADILTINDTGVSVMQRSSLVIAKDPVQTLAVDKSEAKNKDFKERKKVDASDDALDFEADESGEGGGDGAADMGGTVGSTGATRDGFDPAAPPPAEPADQPSRRFAGPMGGHAAEQREERPAPLARPVQASVARPDTSAANERSRSQEIARAPQLAQSDEPQPIATKQQGPVALTGEMAAIHEQLAAGEIGLAVAAALRWRTEDAGNVMALVALGETLEAAQRPELAARAYGSIIDLFPSRADLRRFASARLARLQATGLSLSIDSARRAVEQRPDHLSVHRLLAYALIRAGKYEEAFAAIEFGLAQNYPEGRFAGGVRILREDLGIIGAVWLAAAPEQKSKVQARLKTAGAELSTRPSTRFVLNWETDANDVDFHIYDGKGGHAYYSDKVLPSGGALFEDVTTGYGPECFAIEGVPTAFPYTLQIHYYSRGPMGYGMGQVEVLQHDGEGHVKLEDRPFVVMNDGAFVDLGTIDKPL